MAPCQQVVNLGRYDIDTWYYSPYPEPYRSVDKLYICEYDLKYFRKPKSLEKHLANDVPHHPPGVRCNQVSETLPRCVCTGLAYDGRLILISICRFMYMTPPGVELLVLRRRSTKRYILSSK